MIEVSARPTHIVALGCQQNLLSAVGAPRRCALGQVSGLRQRCRQRHAEGNQDNTCAGKQATLNDVADQLNDAFHNDSSLPHTRQVFNSSPGRVHMAAFTVAAKSAIVNIVLRVTIVTRTRQANLFHCLGMTLSTLETFVFTC